MRKFNNAEMVIIRRVAMSVKSLRAKEESKERQIQKLMAEKEEINQSIELFEAPIRQMSGGFTSTEILSGGGEAGTAVEEVKAEAIADEEKAPMKKVKAEDAVQIDKEALDAAKVAEGATDTDAAPWN